MTLILAIGDFHVPERAAGMPDKFHKLLTPGKVAQVLCLGNATLLPLVVLFLSQLSPDLQMVRGEFDAGALLPVETVVSHGQLRIGMVNGYLVVPNSDPLELLALARKLDVDVLLWGGTHRVEAYTLDGKFFVNPGTATGAFHMGDVLEADEAGDLPYTQPQDPSPTFCLLDVQGSVCLLYIYTYVDGEVKVDKISYTKE